MFHWISVSKIQDITWIKHDKDPKNVNPNMEYLNTAKIEYRAQQFALRNL